MTQKNQIYAGILVGFTLISVCMAGCPMYRVYSAQKTGEAELRRATYNRQIAVQEANAKKEAASSLADAEVIRAQGVAKANLIIGQSLQNNEIYLYYLWLQTLEATAGEGQTIYIPTSGNNGAPGVFPSMSLPVTEATRMSNTNKTSQ